jgi:RNA polymerase-binding transcription factor DksA
VTGSPEHASHRFKLRAGARWRAACNSCVHMKKNLMREQLVARRRNLLARYQHELDLAGEELDSREIEAVENATELWDARVLSILSGADARALRDIVAAIRRIDDGSYGRCTACGAAIDPGRLDAVPETPRCHDCASAIEAFPPA